MADFVTPLMNTLQAQAQLNLTGATAEDTHALAQMRMQSVVAQQLQLQQMRTAQQVYQSAQQDPSSPFAQPLPQVLPTDTSAEAEQKNAQILMAQAARKNYLLDKLRSSGVSDPHLLTPMEQEATMAGYRATAAMREARQTQTANNSTIGEAALQAVQADNLQAGQLAIKQIAGIDPKAAQALQGMAATDDQGNMAWNDLTKQAFKTYGNALIGAKEADLMKAKADAVAVRQAESDRKALDDARKDRETDAKIALDRARADALTNPQVKPTKPDPIIAAANRPATVAERGAAQDAVSAADLGGQWDSSTSKRAFANDVADRARKVRADSVRAGIDMGLDDAREQAIEELKPFVVPTTVPTGGVMGFFQSDSPRITYKRGATAAANGAPQKTAPAATGVPEVTSQDQYDALPAGANYMSGGKRYIKK